MVASMAAGRCGFEAANSAAGNQTMRRAGSLCRSIIAIALLGLAIVTAGSCSLHFADNGGALPSGAKTIYVARFTNLTRVPGINDKFMRYMVNEIDSRGRLTVVDEPAQADLTLTGQILYAGLAPGAFSSIYEPLSYSNNIVVAATLSDSHTHKVIWKTSGISDNAGAAAVAQAIVPTTPQFLQQNLRGSDLLRMTDLQVSATQNALASRQMMQQTAAEVYADMAWGL